MFGFSSRGMKISNKTKGVRFCSFKHKALIAKKLANITNKTGRDQRDSAWTAGIYAVFSM
ncbi:Hypothetical protein FKW44_015927, partial [Caligus rogercresseyi]